MEQKTKKQAELEFLIDLWMEKYQTKEHYTIQGVAQMKADLLVLIKIFFNLDNTNEQA